MKQSILYDFISRLIFIFNLLLHSLQTFFDVIHFQYHKSTISHQPFAMENGAHSEGKDPSSFLSEIIGAPVTVKLNSGVIYKGTIHFLVRIAKYG